MSLVKIVSCKTAEEFLDYLRPVREHWRSEKSLEREWLFRGQWDAAWKLIPSAYRDSGRAMLRSINRTFDSISLDAWQVLEVTFASRLRGSGYEPTKEKFEAAYFQYAAEFEAVGQFARFADQLGFPVPQAPDTFLEINEYARRLTVAHIGPGAVGRNPFQQAAISEVFGYAQHHKVPTRLLDWTKDPLTAAYFSVAEEGRVDNNTEIAVWALNEEFLRGSSRRIQFLRCARANHSYLHAQEGAFTFCRDPYVDYFRSGSWPAVEDVLDAELASDSWNRLLSPIRKITFPRAEADRLLGLLLLEGYSKAHLMPTLDNISESIKTKWRLQGA